MGYEIAADLTATLHFTFIGFVVFGVLFGRRSRLWMALHLAAMAYGVMIEVFYWYCPLTILEQYLRSKAGRGQYQDAFIAHYLNRVIYLDAPQWTLVLAAALVFAANLAIYLYWYRWQRRRAGAS